jgi:hypothetical protein
MVLEHAHEVVFQVAIGTVGALARHAPCALAPHTWAGQLSGPGRLARLCAFVAARSGTLWLLRMWSRECGDQNDIFSQMAGRVVGGKSGGRVLTVQGA